MCGLAGFVERPLHSDADRTVRRMATTLRHRGPDSEGYFVGGTVAMGVRRLAVLDLVQGDQPISNEDATVWAALNGEIYNVGALRTRLQELGHRFTTRSDTEVVVHAFEEYGPACVDDFDGMFVCAVWDTRQETLFLARDRMGEKPLYYSAGHSSFVFGSEIRAVLEHPHVSRCLSVEALDAYLAFE